jgi:hypothetical protein
MPATAAQIAAAAKAFTPALVTKDELLELADSERKYAKANREKAAAEKDLEFRRQSLAEKVLGVKSKDELKRLSPEQVLKIYQRRWEREEWRTERGAPEFAFVKTSQGRYPAWREVFIGELGETAAARISAETPTTYSYAVEVVLP